MGLMDMFGKKSPLVDTQKNLNHVKGAFSGTAQMGPDGDFSVWFTPENKQYLLNRDNKPNPNGMVELKVKVDAKYKQAFVDAANSLQGQTVFVSGVLVNDDSKGGKAEVNPLDMIYGPLPPDKHPAWFKDIQSNLKDPNAVLVYKIAAASDASKANKPPRAEETRTLHTTLPYAPKPNFPKIKVDFEIRKIVNSNADIQLANQAMQQKIELDLSVQSAKEGGPGVFVGDWVCYWGNE